jgi:nitrogen fixation NifU-like protein
MAEEYSDKVLEHFRNPHNVGELTDPDGVGSVGNPACGDIMELAIRVRDGIVSDAKFRTFGCGAAIATSSMMTDLVRGKTLEQAAAIAGREVTDALDGLPKRKRHCSFLAADALRAALIDYYRRREEPLPARLAGPGEPVGSARTGADSCGPCRDVDEVKGDAMLVKDWMSRKPWTITEERSIKEAKELMMEHKVRRLPVVAGDILVGIITKDDILAASPSIIDFQTTDEIKKHLEETSVASVMTEDPYTVTANAPVEDAARLMAEKKVGALPVLEGGALSGVITETDIFRALVKVLGISRDHERLDLVVDSAEDALEQVLAKLKSEGKCVLSLFSFEANDKGKIRVIVHLAKD